MSSKYEVDIATAEDVAFVSTHLREGDRLEVQALHGEGVNISVVLRRSWMVSRDTTFVGKADGEALCLFGVSPPGMLGNVATPWLMGTDGVRLHSRHFLRASRRIVGLWAEVFPVMRNYVDERNQDAIRWIQWLGFQVYCPQPFGPFKKPFCRFEMRTQ